MASAATGPALDELQSAAGLEARQGLATALGLVSAVSGGDIGLAVRLWTNRNLPLEPAYTAALPDEMYGTLTGVRRDDEPALDAWATKHTKGMVPAIGIKLEEAADWREGTLMVAASALAVDTEWTESFELTFIPVTKGPWQGRRLKGLERGTSNQEDVAVAHESPVGTLSLFAVRGKGDVDVYLAMAGYEYEPSAVLAAMCDILVDGAALARGPSLPDGFEAPGLRVHVTGSMSPFPQLIAVVPPFEVRSKHDLTQAPDVFGLEAAMDRTTGHFPGISTFPLAVNQAIQQATATFSAKGFRASAVTAIEWMAGGGPPYRARCIDVVFDRPFGFAARHRPTGMITIAGWVHDVQDYRLEGAVEWS
jgi:Serpin (serine protease inhibitor)